MAKERNRGKERDGETKRTPWKGEWNEKCGTEIERGRRNWVNTTKLTETGREGVTERGARVEAARS